MRSHSHHALLAMTLATFGCTGDIGDALATAGALPDPMPRPVPPATCDPARAPSAGATPLRRLTALEYQNSVAAVFGLEAASVTGLPLDERIGPFSANVETEPSTQDIEIYAEVAATVASAVEPRAAELVSCAAPDDACLDRFIRELGLRTWRRPLSDDEVATLGEIAALGEGTERFALVVEALLQSPYFLYVVEGPIDPVPGTVVALDAYERAARLALFLWRSAPDDALLDAAGAGRLDTREGIEAEVSRMLGDTTRFEAMLRRFHLEWLGLLGTDSVPSIYDLEKDPEVNPDWSEALEEAMRREVFQFSVRSYRETEGGTLADLLAGRFSYLDPQMAEFYGLTHPDGDGIDRVEFPEGHARAGILSRAGVLAVYGKAVQSAPIQRGVLVRESLLCLHIVPPPPGTMVDDPPADPTMSRREQFEEHGSAACGASCHSMIDPIGFAFEHFDGAGRYREMDGPGPVDATGRIPSADVDRDVDGAVELADALAESEMVSACFTRQWARFALEREIEEADGGSMACVRERFEESGGDLRTLLVELAMSDLLATRTVE